MELLDDAYIRREIKMPFRGQILLRIFLRIFGIIFLLVIMGIVSFSVFLPSPNGADTRSVIGMLANAPVLSEIAYLIILIIGIIGILYSLRSIFRLSKDLLTARVYVYVCNIHKVEKENTFSKKVDYYIQPIAPLGKLNEWMVSKEEYDVYNEQLKYEFILGKYSQKLFKSQELGDY